MNYYNKIIDIVDNLIFNIFVYFFGKRSTMQDYVNQKPLIYNIPTSAIIRIKLATR